MNERERAVALYTFLKEFSQLRTRTVRDVDTYEQVIWVSDIPQQPGCDCIAWHRDVDDVSDKPWIEIRRPRLRRPPEPPELTQNWVRREQLNDSSLDIPELHTTLLGESSDDLPLRLEDHPEVQEVWERYIEDYWWAWSEEDRREQAVGRIYTDLFSMFQRQQRLGEAFEIVFGLGYLNWTPPDSLAVRRHLAVARVNVEFDAESGTLTVAPASDGARPTLEQDMLDPQYRPDPQELLSIEEELEDIGESVWAVGPLDGLLKSWVHSVDARGEYNATLERHGGSGRTPVVHLAPALILRARTERSYIRAFEDIIDQLEAGEPVPEGVSRFISASEDQVPSDAMSNLGNAAPLGEFFFPLPANDAQRQIVERLSTNQGVLVQGPPGTGKSHTIVNLICHALATGQRILVTSHAPRALGVLHDMIREHTRDIAALSVVLLGDNRQSLDAMEASVQGILSRHNTWTPTKSQATISSLERELDQWRRREAEVLADLRAIREQETFRHEVKLGYSGTLARIADTLRGEREQLDWIPDELAEDLEPPLTGDEFSELIVLLGNSQVSEWESGGWTGINVDHLPTAEAFEQAVLAEHESRTAYEHSDSIRQWPEYSSVEKLTRDDYRDVEKGLGDLIQLIDSINQRPLPWTETATKQILGGFERTWQQLYEATTKTVERTAEFAGWLDANAISPVPGADLQKLRAEVGDLHAHLEAGGRWGIGPFRTTAVKRASYIRDLRIGGRLCRTVDTVGDLLKRLDAEIEFRHLRERWAPYHDFTASTFTDCVAEMKDLCEPLEDAFGALTIAGELSEILRRTPGTSVPDWSDQVSLHRLSDALAALEAAQQYEAARAQIDRVFDELRVQRRHGQLDPVVDELILAVTNRNVSTYTIARQLATDNLELAAQLDRKLKLLDRLAAGAPDLAGTLTAEPSTTLWAERAVDFERAWNWSRAHAWVTRLAAPDAEQQYRLELDARKQALAHTLAKLAAEKAWTHCFDHMTDNERQHLLAWQQAMRRIGKGTGKYAPQHRRDAREHLDKCRSAIPAWVMPLHRVAETIQQKPDLFDIAIIDEASQSGPEALLLAWLAKKVVVVGDDKQIHPTDAGVNFEAVNQLRDRYISGLTHADALGAQGGSFFDLAEIFFKGRIRLREHFRCMPEIIQFSNNLSYATEPLIPLRQYGAGRLEPPVATWRVLGGYQQGTAGHAVNPPEAEAVVEQIARICKDPSYNGRTIGVISLLGNAQARTIETRLLREIGPEEMERRQLVCGDAYAFQGDERDVMFLSMVSAPGEGRTIPALTDQAAQRRFNVAASRARDQMYLFHSAGLDELSGRQDCVRRQLLEYCLNPRVAMADSSGLDVPELERMALQGRREPGNQPAPFDSWFELDVFLRIARHGYRVIPQHEVGGYRIDLVVQGMNGSLAVECDGDEWHPRDRYEEDAARQRDLERCGWEFWRVRESVFRLDPDEALENLWETLERRSVFPTTQDNVGRKGIASSIEISPTVRDSGDAFEVTNDQIDQGAGERNTHPETLSRGGLTGATGGAASTDSETDRRAISNGGKASWEVRSDYPGSKTRDPEPSEEKPENVPQSASPLSTSDLGSDAGQGALSQYTLSGIAIESAAKDVGKASWLAPYTGWTPTGTIPNPRNDPDQADLVSLLTEVVEREGPVVAIRAYRLINRASGSQRLTGPVRRMLNRASAAAIREGIIVDTNPFNVQGQGHLVLRMPGTPSVSVRERGSRELDELPPDEVAAMLRFLRETDSQLDQEQLKRQLLSALGWVRLTPNVSEFLDRCIALI